MTLQPPNEEIHEKEIVGRRAFGRDKKIFYKTGQILHYKLDVFIDKRPGGVSVDRLGVGQCEKKRIVVLDPLGIAMGASRNTPFRGWAQLPIYEFHKFTKATQAEGEVNPYHAEIMRDDFPTDAAKRALAYTMCVLASSKDFVPTLTESAESA